MESSVSETCRSTPKGVRNKGTGCASFSSGKGQNALRQRSVGDDAQSPCSQKQTHTHARGACDTHEQHTHTTHTTHTHNTQNTTHTTHTTQRTTQHNKTHHTHTQHNTQYTTHHTPCTTNLPPSSTPTPQPPSAPTPFHARTSQGWHVFQMIPSWPRPGHHAELHHPVDSFDELSAGSQGPGQFGRDTQGASTVGEEVSGFSVELNADEAC